MIFELKFEILPICWMIFVLSKKVEYESVGTVQTVEEPLGFGKELYHSS